MSKQDSSLKDWQKNELAKSLARFPERKEGSAATADERLSG
ncbi:hypothetical protein H206_01843 [Candidatus Electrothrix aarhusensis]|uniref:Uncharacterized protein n=1 Tax=Candidatus Electrothrix aarhusensis TaxID=1859131 RepID=A0A444ITW2_9BACT|nr:hypothetical protein H206_01843 [Candidatus Electrothrix aarhusensis]